MNYTYEEIAKMIDHSLLHPKMTDEELERGCRVAIHYDVATVCIKPYYLRRCAEILEGSTVKPTTTVGFPHGSHATRIKVAEAASPAALERGSWVVLSLEATSSSTLRRGAESSGVQISITMPRSTRKDSTRNVRRSVHRKA